MLHSLRSIGLAACLLGIAASATFAQTSAVPSVEAGKPFRIAADHDGVNTTSYLLRLNGKQVAEVPASARVNGSVPIDVAALPVGSYQAVMVARNAPTAPFTDPTETSSPVYTFEVRTKAPAPTAPAWRAVVLIAANGSITVESIVAVEETPPLVRLMRDGLVRIER